VKRTRVLVIDDEPLVRRSMRRALGDAGFEIAEAATVAEGLTTFESERPQVVVLDVRLPDGSGLDLLPQLRRADPAVKVVMVTAFGETADVVRAMRLGASDFLKKPYDLQELEHAVRSAARSLARDQQLKVYRKRDRARYARTQMIGHSPQMEALREVIRKVALSEMTSVLLMGESGTGKELVARAVHFQSARRDAPLMEVNCSSFQESLLENELFGHEKGAYTGASYLKRGIVELCDGGTLFLDEVSETPSRVQAKLLRFIDSKTFMRVGGNVDLGVDIRLIAASNANLEDLIAAGRFRSDLYYRLKVVSIALPPLRDRGDDILLLASAFLQRFSRSFHKDFESIQAGAARCLLRYRWPGNVRELENLIERVVLLEEGPELRAAHLPPEIQRAGDLPEARASEYRPLVSVRDADGAVACGAASETTLLDRLGRRLQEAGDDSVPSLRQVGDAYIDLILDACAGNRSQAARLLGLSRQGLLERLRRMQSPFETSDTSTSPLANS
jgi:two-component system response regulator AtoC